MGYWDKKLITNFWENKAVAREENFKSSEILEAKYEIPDLRRITDKQTHLSSEEKEVLFNLLHSHQDLFLAKPGKWQGPPVDIELKKGAKPQHSAPYRIPQAHLKTMQQ